ncbi:HEAT repeat domain-containing protein [Pimelobacter simplex]|uniref:HEAT repeat domain-containing protein n=1 Tax=Nocardioides simplex TaxID=2045 RepID=UPI003AAEB6AB
MSLSPPDAFALADELARAVTHGGASTWASSAASMAALSGRDWLVLDAAARSYRLRSSMPISGARGWLGPSLNEPSACVAAVTSMHVDGRIRERATLALGELPGTLAVTAAAVRLLDHVEQVRVAARQSLAALLVSDPRPELAVRALEVVLAGRDRLQGAGAREAVEDVAADLFEEAGYVQALMAAGPRDVRRYGFEAANELGLLTVPRLLDAARDEEDQLIVAWCADWLYDRGTSEDLAGLLDARSAVVRQAAVLRVDDTVLSDDRLRSMLADRAPRVREAVRHRARKRGLDLAAWYRDALVPDAPAHRTAAILDGLLASGGASDLPSFESALADPRPRVRSAAVRGIAAWTSGAETVERLAPMLTDSSGRVSATVARVLARAGAPETAAAEAWASPMAGSRRAAWYLTRSAGGWNAVEADLRLATDADADLAGLGRAQVSNWLTTRAATTWQPLPVRQRARIADLIAAWDAPADLKRTLAFHAGIRLRPGADSGATEEPARVIDRKRRWWWGR